MATQLLQRLQERRDVGLRAWIVRVDAALEHADAPHSLGLLPARYYGPHRRAAKSRDERAPPHASLPKEQGRLTHALRSGLFDDTRRSRCVRVLDLDPIRTSPRAIGPVAAFGGLAA